MKRTATLCAATAVLSVVVAACSPPPDRPDEPLGPPVPTGATVIPGEPTEQIPVPPNPKTPASQQEAQQTLLEYLQRTIDVLPAGTSLDGSRYVVGDGTNYCEDDPSGPDAPVRVEDWRDMLLPPGTDFTGIVIQTGEVWKRWGWQVIEREGFSKPNRFGYAPDGYVLQIEARPDPAHPPSLIGSSPCFPGNLRGGADRNPVTIEQSP